MTTIQTSKKVNMKRDFGYTDPRDIEWAERTSSTSKSGLPYGTSPSQKEDFARAQPERDKTPFLDAFLIAGVVCIAGIFLLSYFLKP